MRVAFGALSCAVLLVCVAIWVDHGSGDDDSLRVPGWRLDVESHGRAASLHTHEVGFVLSPDESLHPTVPAEGLRARYRGRLRLEEAGAYRLHWQSDGGSVTFDFRQQGRLLHSVTAADGGKDDVDLPAGNIDLDLRFERSGEQAARLALEWERLGWEGGFAPAPFSPRDITTTRVPVMEHRERARRGRLLLTEFGCVQCHATRDQTRVAVHARAASYLGWVAATMRPAGVSAWIEHAEEHSQRSHMPDVFGSMSAEERREVTEDLMAFLWSLAPTMDPGVVATEERLLDQGREYYHTLGCVPCHGAMESPAVVYATEALSHEVPALNQRQLELRSLGDKWTPVGLSRFLRNPTLFHPSGTMPSLGLSEEESDALTHYLLTEQPPENRSSTRPDLTPERVARGRESFVELGCANCHSLGHGLEEFSARTFSPLEELDPGRGCLSGDIGEWPRYFFDGEQRLLLKEGLLELRNVVAAAPKDALERELSLFRCQNCHSRDGSQRPDADLDVYFAGDEDVELGDEGRIPPDLANVGFKLKPSWLHAVLLEGERARPYMATRMPEYGVAMHVRDAGDTLAPSLDSLPQRLARHSGVVDDETKEVADGKVVLAGRSLAGDQGLNCISCHVFGDLPPAGVPGPDLEQFGERLRQPWWEAYARSPHRLKPGTRMPAFFASEKTSALDTLDGESHAQIDALWHYFALGEEMPVPSGVTTGEEMQLLVGERPRVFRGFLGDAGSRAIAVGYPIGLHFAFDADRCRLVDAWRGDFLNASGSWAGRGGQNLGGQGESVWKANKRPVVMLEPGKEPAWRFRGYRFDANGLPIFRYSAAGVEVEESFYPDPDPAVLFTRRFHLSSSSEEFECWIDAHEGSEMDTEKIDAISAAGNDGRYHLVTNSGQIKVELKVQP